MPHTTRASSPKSSRRKGAGAAASKSLPGSQTLWRALNVLEEVAAGAVTLNELAAGTRLTRSTAHRLAAALVDRRYLTFAPGDGYQLGPKLLELGFQAQHLTDLTRIARPHLERLAQRTGEATYLGTLDRTQATILDKASGSRRLEPQILIGERLPLHASALGKALILDREENRWRDLYTAGRGTSSVSPDLEAWTAHMRDYVRRGVTYDLGEYDDALRGIAAPIRDARGAVIGAVGLISAARYMNDEYMKTLAKDVKDAANAISADRGWKVRA